MLIIASGNLMNSKFRTYWDDFYSIACAWVYVEYGGQHYSVDHRQCGYPLSDAPWCASCAAGVDDCDVDQILGLPPHWPHSHSGGAACGCYGQLLLLGRAASVVASAARVVRKECSAPDPGVAVGIPCYDPFPQWVGATFGAVAFVDGVGGGAHFSHDIRAVIVADGRMVEQEEFIEWVRYKISFCFIILCGRETNKNINLIVVSTYTNNKLNPTLD